MGREVSFNRAGELEHLPLVCAVTGSEEGVERTPITSKWTLQKGPVRGVRSAMINAREAKVRLEIPLSENARRELQRLTRMEIAGTITSGLMGVGFCVVAPAGEDAWWTVPLMLAILITAPLPWLATHLARRRRTPRVRPKGSYGHALYVPSEAAAEEYQRAIWGDA